MLPTFEAPVSSPPLISVLKAGIPDKDTVQQLQIALYPLSFAQQLQWNDSSPQGTYDEATVTAVRAFAHKNGLTTDGRSLSTPLGQALVDRCEVAQGLRVVQDAIDHQEVGQTFAQGSSDKAAVGVGALRMNGHLPSDWLV